MHNLIEALKVVARIALSLARIIAAIRSALKKNREKNC